MIQLITSQDQAGGMGPGSGIQWVIRCQGCGRSLGGRT